jgi:DNA polymerase I-like protein with 3'-5' exonuclease and polymerase domains
MVKNEDWYVILNMDCRYEICRRCPKSGLFKGTFEECEKWIEQKKNEEMIEKAKNSIIKKISNVLLKDPILQMSFELICNENAKLREIIRNEIDDVQKKNESNIDDENLKRDLSKIMNIHGIDTECSTPDYILAEYLIDCLKSYKKLDNANRTWHGLSIEGELKL